MNAKELFKRLESALTAIYSPDESRFLAKVFVEARTGIKFPSLKTVDESLANAVLNDDLGRLLAGEPYQYVLGEAPFLDFFVEVNSDVLIPRPETEELAQKAVALWRKTGGSVMDVGTGSGCLAIALARAGATVYALEPSVRALAVARQNARRLCPKNMPVFVPMRIEDLTQAPECTLVVSNPPYVPPDFPICPRVRDHEPHSALFTPPNDPLYFYRLIVQKTRFENVIFEVHEHYADATAEFLTDWGLKEVKVEKDFRGNPRFVRASVHGRQTAKQSHGRRVVFPQAQERNAQ